MRTPVVFVVSFCFPLLTWLLLSGLNLNSDRFDRELQALDDFSELERGLNREVLTARAGLSRNYDALARMTDAYAETLDRLREAAGADSEESSAIEVLATRGGRQTDLIEQFKSRNALLRNSFAYFGMFSARLAASDDRSVVAAVSTLASAMLHLTLDTSPTVVREVRDRLEQLAHLQRPPGDVERIQAALAHGGLLHDLLPATDTALKALIAASSTQEQDTVRSLLMKRQLAARAKARQYRLLLYAASLMLLAALAYLGLQLRARAVALRRRAAFEHVIAGISTRFINSQHHEISEHVESALEKLAGCVGADRAYFVVVGESKQIYRWARGGTEFPPGWPERAMHLASRFEQAEGGIIHVPKVRPAHPEDTMNLLVDAGLQGWLCIPSISERASAILGFDTLSAGALIRSAEVTLFRMAFDAIGHAVGRVVLEREKERLEANLQQARRMETIGTFSSGIAHNFNNIVGAILGYTEMADDPVKSGVQPVANLTEIRRAGERARELVGQILKFGRRGEGRRERVRVSALVAETKRLLTASLPSHVGISMVETSEAAVVSAELAQLQQVILNVCNNAAQAMDEPGVVEIRIEMREVTEVLRVGRIDIGPGRFVIISISDPGRGMDEATLERIFEPFFTTRPEGNGLGLATAREIVEEHDGTVAVQSMPGVGTRFDIWLPSVLSSEPISVRHLPDVTGCGDGETVLVLETERERLLRHEEILAALGYEPVGFTEVAEAVQADAVQARFDAALVSHQHGAASAIDFATALHDIAPDLPIILATPSARDLDASRLAASGISEVVHHPLSSAELAGALSRCLPASVASQFQ
jgi:signal transduction histidine kinase/CheY-like chemotaxis protein